jgi:signal transduction histidine kinase
MRSQAGVADVAGEIGLRLAEIANSSENARKREAAIVRLLRVRLGATYVACSQRITRAGHARGMRLRASDADAMTIHPILTQAARLLAREWLAAGRASQCILDDPRFSGWQVSGCLPRDGLIVVAVWPPHGDAAAGAEILDALAPLVSLALGRGAERSQARSGGGATEDAAKASFVSLVSHALRTPLNTLTGFIEIVMDQPIGPLNARQREFLTYARESGQALTQLVEDVTLLSHADEGSLTLRCERLDAAEIARSALQAIERAAEARGVRLGLSIAREAPSIEGDGERLARALAKLLENAVKFSPEGGEVSVTVAANGATAAFAVRDIGMGVAPEDAERIFMRFYQAERTAKSHPGGYGLGLAVARTIALAHRGDIWVESANGRGAIFTLGVPINGAAATDQRVATKSRRGASGATSLRS